MYELNFVEIPRKIMRFLGKFSNTPYTYSPTAKLGISWDSKKGPNNAAALRNLNHKETLKTQSNFDDTIIAPHQ